jgi:riboflavin synthase
MRTVLALMVMPRSRSISIASSICSFMSRSATVPVSWISRSARVDLPWSICATMEKLRIWASSVMGGICGGDLGASIACDGVCLTVVDTGAEGGNWFDVQISAETLDKTNLGGWVEGARINLERALRVGDELGGHIVSGHVDGVARVVELRDEGDSLRVGFEVPAHLAGFIAPKGSVALNGTSLTVNEVAGTRFGVNLIPHTRTVTTWGAVADGRCGEPGDRHAGPLRRAAARMGCGLILRPKGTARGIGRSLRLYHGDPARAARMDALYGQFLRPGALAFDIGAHVGDRVSSFRRLGARVVAVEPQPGAFRALRLIHGRDAGVQLVQAAVGDHEGSARLNVNTRNPTTSTLSEEFIRATEGAHRGGRGRTGTRRSRFRC